MSSFDNQVGRRQFIGLSAGAVAGAAALAAAPATVLSNAVAAVRPAVITAGRRYLDFDGVSAGPLHSVEGGDATADVITEPDAGSGFTPKHLGAVRYEDFSAQVAPPLSTSLGSWVQSMWLNGAERRSGSVIFADAAYKVRSVREFSSALLVETTVPALDAAARDAGYIGLRFAPEVTADLAGDGSPVAATPRQAPWLRSGFRLQIDGLDCSQVSAIDSFTVRRALVPDAIGEERDYQRVPGLVEFPNLVVTLADSSSESWRAWFRSFLIEGNNVDGEEKGGTLQLLMSDLTAVAEIRFFNLGIFKLAQRLGSGDTVSRLTAHLYCERMAFGPPSL